MPFKKGIFCKKKTPWAAKKHCAASELRVPSGKLRAESQTLATYCNRPIF